MSRTVKAPPQIEALFDKAEEQVSRFFQDRQDDPTKGTIEISNERFVLVRGASLSVEFFDILKRIFAHSEQEATSIASQVLFDVAHALGKADARHFHQKMGLSDPISKMAPGPIFFSHAGWAFVNISEESKPEPNENYFLLYDHVYSFEADAWIRAGKHSDFPVCLMNAGYSSGWCEESFGMPLVATEVSCRAMGDAACRFIMAPPGRIDAHLAHHLGHAPTQRVKIAEGQIGKSFNRDWAKEALLEKWLQDSETNYRSLFELSPDAIVVWDTNGIIQAVNAFAAAMGGYEKAEDFIGKNWQDFVVPEDLPARVERLKTVSTRGGITEAEFRLRRKDGSQFFVQGRVLVVLDEAGKPIRFIGAIRDISDRKAAEAAMYLSEARFRRAFPLAEKTGAICALGRWVLDQACRQFKAWRDQGIAPPLLAINVSAAELRVCVEFEAYLADNLKQWSIAPGDIELEITESVLMETTQTHSDALARIERLGASIAIDDFGTGYSSLAYLSAYPVSRLKLAQQFILGIPENAGDVAITRATLSLARELGIEVIAEGVQTKAQLDFLMSAGCPVGQGFYFSEAVQAGRAAEFLRRGVVEPACRSIPFETPVTAG